MVSAFVGKEEVLYCVPTSFVEDPSIFGSSASRVVTFSKVPAPNRSVADDASLEGASTFSRNGILKGKESPFPSTLL
jgi:hypothetical protein